VKSLANILEVPCSQLASWFYGKIKMPSHILEELEQIKEQFLKWEAKHGYMFNSRPKPKPICPYAESGLKFRRDFDKYTVCDGCNLRSACEKS
jgi:predicted acyl esterase